MPHTKAPQTEDEMLDRIDELEQEIAELRGNLEQIHTLQERLGDELDSYLKTRDQIDGLNPFSHYDQTMMLPVLKAAIQDGAADIVSTSDKMLDLLAGLEV